MSRSYVEWTDPLDVAAVVLLAAVVLAIVSGIGACSYYLWAAVL